MMWRMLWRDLACLIRIISLPAMVLAVGLCLVCNCWYRATDRPGLFAAAWGGMIVFSLFAGVYLAGRSLGEQRSDVRAYTQEHARGMISFAVLAGIVFLLLLLASR